MDAVLSVLSGRRQDAAEGALVVQTFIAEPSNERRASFLSGYARKYKGKVAVPMAAANAYDATYLLMYSFLGIRDGNLNGKAIKESLEGKMKTYYGVVTTYDKPFSAQDKDAITRNMLVMGVVKNGAITFAYPEGCQAQPHRPAQAITKNGRLPATREPTHLTLR